MLKDPKTILAGLAAIGIGAGGMAGYVKIQTPEAAQCQVDLARASTRIELSAEAMNLCKEALETCVSSEGK